MATEIRWTPSARADVRTIRAWLKERSRALAVRFADDVRNAVRLLQDFPHLGPVARDIEPVGRYRHVVKGYHRIIYRIDGAIIVIVRVWDSRKNPEDLKALD